MSSAVAVEMKPCSTKHLVILKPSFQLTVGEEGLSVAVRAVFSDGYVPPTAKTQSATH